MHVLAPLFALVGASMAGADWPQFLGPARDGTSPDRVLVSGWLERGLRVRWRKPVGEGYSSVVAVGERLYSMDAEGASEFAFARRAEDGAELWRVRVGASPRDVYGGLGPRVTPTWAERGFGKGSLILAAEHLIVLGEDGELALVRPDPARLDVRARLPVLSGTCWTPPSLANGRLYLRNAREMLALEPQP